MKKILIIFGTRPEAIKMAPIINEFKKNKNVFSFKVCVTGQHKKMLRQVLDFFKIKPAFNLNLMVKNQSLEKLTCKILQRVSIILDEYKPDLVIVHGDTTTTFAASLAAFYKRIEICHIEAGLRTNNMYSPWPEEVNRKLTSHLAKFHFAPTYNSRKNLILENINSNFIKVTGNTVIDAFLLVHKKIFSTDLIKERFDKKYSFLNFNKKKIILVTSHRRENFGKEFENILNALRHIALKNKNISIIYPVHLNPKILIPAKKILSQISNIFLIKPVNYQEFVYLMTKSYIIVSDSGGIQEEASFIGKPVLITRNTTERPETIKKGTAKLIGTDKKDIISVVEKLLNNNKIYRKMSRSHNAYGDGYSSKKILAFLKLFL
jgi:UDP-N-acetylglucosamine 2-epimerase (non-hydrolysing)